MIVVDSSVWIAHLRGQTLPSVQTLASISRARSIIVGDIVLLEVLRGARDGRHAAKIETELRQFRMENMLDPSIAVKAASHYRTLRSKGVTMSKTADLIIATFCIERGYALLHQDRDFDPMALHLGLRVA